ncbi:MAG: DNA adenine methylase [Blastocatellia bacterium]
MKWIGNKQRFAHEIISYFPTHFNVYREPFLGSGAVLGTLAPVRAVGSDAFGPLIEIWETVQSSPETAKSWYADRWNRMNSGEKTEIYGEIRDSYNSSPNGADLLFLSRSCYGGVVRFRQFDGFMSTPCGPHDPISPESFSERVDTWNFRTRGTKFVRQDYGIAIDDARPGDLIYCDPPYSYSQSILYGAQTFDLVQLFELIRQAKGKGIYVALSIDGSKKSGDFLCDFQIPAGVFEREVMVNCGRSMLKRFQMDGQTLESEIVHDRLLLTY